MAIDPSIALGFKAPQGPSLQDYVQMGATAQQIAQSKAATANLQAQNPGIEADAAAKVLAQQQNLARVAASQSAIETDPTTGQPIVDPLTGTAKINMPKYQYALFQAGLGTEAMQAEAKLLENNKAQLANQAASQGISQTNFDQTSQIRNFVATAAAAAREQAIKNGAKDGGEAAAQATWNDLSAKAVANSGKNGGTPIDPAQMSYQPGSDKVLFQAQITPGSQIALNQAQQGLDLTARNTAVAEKSLASSLQQSFTDADSMNADSPTSQRARDIVYNTTGQTLPKTMSASQIYLNPQYKGILSSTGANAGASIAAANTELNKWQSLDSTLQKAKGQLGSLNLSPAQFVQNWVSGKIGNTPELQALYSQMAQIDPNVLANAKSFDALHATNQAMIDQAGRNVKTASGQNAGAIVPGSGASPNVEPGKPVAQPNAKPATVAPTNTPAKPAAAGFTRMTDPASGKIMDIPNAKVAAATKDGLQLYNGK